MNLVLALHQWLYERSHGLVGHRVLGVPTLLLTTTGRRSGLPRTAALVYAEHGGELGVIASAGGADSHPAWFLNLQADPDVRVRVGRSVALHAASVAVGDERSVWWARCNAVNKNRFDDYQRSTERQIPVIVLRSVS